MDPAAASERALQVAALVDPARPRVLSVLVSDPDGVRTAGAQPAPVLDDMVVTVLDEIGVPTLAEFPKLLIDEVVQAADIHHDGLW